MEWIEEQKIAGKVIYHFGTGSHHLVGLKNLEAGAPNNWVGVTASPGEAEAFTKLAIEHPRLSANYSVHFGDIYLFNGKLLPKFDIATMFHLCEFRSEKNDSYGALTDEDVLRRVIQQMTKRGIIVFYEGSDGWTKTRPIVEKLAGEGLIEKAGQYKSLPIYRVA
jgi:hypothetical protein